MSKIVLPDGTPANKKQAIVGPGGETLSGEIPDNAPKALIMAVLFLNKLSNEVEYSGAAIVPLKSFIEVSKKGEAAVEALHTEIFLQIFVAELKNSSPEKLENLKTTEDLYRYMVSNYTVQPLPIIGANTILALNFEEGNDEDSASVPSEDPSEE